MGQSGAAALEVTDLVTEFRTPAGVGRAVNGISFHVDAGETLGIVGESGCGKSVTALSILRLVPSPPGHIVAGTALLEGRDLLSLPEREMRDLRGNRIAMIFQEPMTCLNPVLTVGFQIAETLRRHQGMSRASARARVVELLDLVRIPEAARRSGEYPHQLSGGMRQRAMIAMALACNPGVLIADEPTTALDVTIQAQVLDLMRDLQERLGTAVVLITHDLGVVAETAHRVVVMYAGRKVEEASVEEIFEGPLHPYTPVNILAAEVIRAMLKKIGVTLNIEVMAVGVAGESFFNAGRFPLYLTGWSRYPEPDWIASLAFKSDGFYNAANLPRPDVDALVEQGASFYDQSDRLRAYRQLNALVLREAWFVPLLYATSYAAAPRRVGNLDRLMGWDAKMNLREIWIAP